MRAYSAASQEALRACDLLKEWAGDGFLSEAQYEQMKRETVHGLRRTNFFLRLVLFLFTLLLAIAVNMLILEPSTGILPGGFSLLVASAICYAAAEFAVAQGRLYRYGIEEALLACSVGFLCVGLATIPFSGRGELMMQAVGAVASLWIWHRFGLTYTFAAAMVFIYWLGANKALSQTEQHVMIAVFYATGLLAFVMLRKRYRLSYLDIEYSIAEALLWFGLYFAINLQLSAVTINGQVLPGHSLVTRFSPAFYWCTWVLTWCLPAVVLIRALRERNRWLILTGMAMALLTFVTNKPYLGRQQQSWDPMLFGGLLTVVAIAVRHWLSRGPGEVRRGYTAKRLSQKDGRWMQNAFAGGGLVLPGTLTPHVQASSSDFHFGGGDAGGGGAASDF